MPVFVAFYMYFADAPPDEPLGETDCCGFNVFNVYSVAVQIEIYISYFVLQYTAMLVLHQQLLLYQHN